jgi:hypothetical protein
METILVVFAIVCAVLSVGFLAFGVAALRRKRLLGGIGGTLLALLSLSLAALFATIALATQGYRALTREEIAAVVITRPTGPQRFDARVQFADGTEAEFALAGDELYVDAHILKWKPLANVIGLHTAYELDRVGGRYFELEDERDSTRTIFSLSRDKPVDMFTLRQRYGFFAPLLDAEYGSGTFVPAGEPAEFEVRVSTTGLLIRRIGPDER